MRRSRNAHAWLGAVVAALACGCAGASLKPQAAPATRVPAAARTCGTARVATSDQPQIAPARARADAENAAEARAVVEALARADGERATRRFGADMLSAFPGAKAVQAFKAVEEKNGAFERVDWTRTSEAGPLTVAWVGFQLEKTALAVKIAFDPDGKIVGFYFVAPSAAPPAEPAPEPPAANVEECDVEVGHDPALPGTITLPRGARAAPAVVLVHGSGPSDRDEILGKTRIFADLALGLAARGIVVLRYDKRSRVQPRGVVTVKEEVIDGALAAVQLLRGFPEVDPARVFVLGHSQGGALAPRIAKADGRLGGVIVLAGPTRPVEDSLVEQLTYFAELEPGNTAISERLDEAKAFRTLVQSPSLEPDTRVHVPGDGTVTGAYFLDLRGYHPEEVAATLACPLLVLQGARDYQVSVTEDFGLWQHALAGNPRATLRAYPALDHRFVAGEGRSTPADYARAGHVAPEVIADIATWVTERSPPRSLR
jgi:dienelactone hydrolase